MTLSGDLRERVAGLLAMQAGSCGALGSPLYEHLLRRAADDVRAGGPVGAVFDAGTGKGVQDAQALRLMAAVHRLVLAGGAPALARHYPSAGGTADPEPAWAAFRATVAEQAGAVRSLMRLPCQTNEVGRTAALLGGFLDVADRWGLPLRLLEVGSSAGLQLRWDRFHFRTGDASWGDPGSPVQILDHWTVPPAHLDADVHVAERRGCDPRPVDPTTPDGRATLRASVWADQVERLERLDGACLLAGRVPAIVDAEGAGTWAARMLATPAGGVATVVFHSVVLQYVAEAERTAFLTALADAGRRATDRAPLAWLRLEPERLDELDRGTPFCVRLATWPGGADRRVASSGAHGASVRWLAVGSEAT